MIPLKSTNIITLSIMRNLEIDLNIKTLWPGGRPYPEPKTGLETMSNIKYWVGVDFQSKGVLRFVNKKCKVYKTLAWSPRCGLGLFYAVSAGV